MIFKQIKSQTKTHTVTSSVETTAYGPFVYICVNSLHHYTTNTNGEIDSRNTNSKEEYCVRQKYFNNQVKIHGDSLNWIINGNIDHREKFVAVGPTRWKDYLEGIESEPSYSHEIQYNSYESSLLDTLKAGEFNRIVIDRTISNRMFYDVNDKPIKRLIFVDYIDSQLKQRSYKLKPLREHLLSLPEVKKVKTIKIPYYNAYTPGEKALEFFWAPPDQETFEEVVSQAYKLGSQPFFRKRLGFDAFLKER